MHIRLIRRESVEREENKATPGMLLTFSKEPGDGAIRILDEREKKNWWLSERCSLQMDVSSSELEARKHRQSRAFEAMFTLKQQQQQQCLLRQHAIYYFTKQRTLSNFLSLALFFISTDMQTFPTVSNQAETLCMSSICHELFSFCLILKNETDSWIRIGSVGWQTLCDKTAGEWIAFTSDSSVSVASGLSLQKPKHEGFFTREHSRHHLPSHSIESIFHRKFQYRACFRRKILYNSRAHYS